jgi:hypothetical protein
VWSIGALKLDYPLTGSSDCATKKPLCLDIDINFTSGLGPGLSNETQIPINPTYGGFASCTPEKEVNPAWFWLKPKRNGLIAFYLLTHNVSDLDFVIWGPFDTPEQGCGSALTSSKEIDCGWQRGETLLKYESTEPFSLERASIPNAIAGKYYVMLINDQTGNTSFYLMPRFNSTDSLDCTFLTEVKTWRINGTGNVTTFYDGEVFYNGTMPMVGDFVTYTFTGLFLNNMPGGDSAKTVRATDFCNASNAGTAREGYDLGPGDGSNVNLTTWTTKFEDKGSFKLCYRLDGYDWQQVGGVFEVGDDRPIPPVRDPAYIPDAIATNPAPWFDFEPKLVVESGPVEFTFFGFDIFAQDHDDIMVKVVVQDCLESYPSVSTSTPQKLSKHNTAKFNLPQPGKYRFCIKHRIVWEESQHQVQVTTKNAADVYYQYSSCEQLLFNEPSYCGCFFDHNVNATQDNSTNVKFPAPVHLPIDFPMSTVLSSTGFPSVNQGCCALNTPVRDTITHPAKTWGMCSEPKPPIDPNQCG